MASRNTLDMTTGPIFRKLLLFAYPLMINSIINTLYGAADKIMAGQFLGDHAVAAVGASASPISLIINLFDGIGLGVGVTCGSLLGGKKQKALRQCMHSAILSGLFCGLFVCGAGMLCSRPLLVAMKTPEEILPGALNYMLIRMAGTPILLTSSFCTNILNAHGDTKRITASGIISGLLNVVGNYIFLTVFHLGISGLALSTVLSQLLELVIRFVILFSQKDIYRLRLAELRIHKQHTKNIFAIGIPNGLNNILFSISNVMLQSSVNSFGATVIAGNSVADTLINFAFMIPSHFSGACSCAVAQCYGAGNYRRIDPVVKKGILGSIGFVSILSALLTVLAEPLIMLFTDDPAVAAAGIPKLLFSCWGYLIYSFSMMYAGALKGLRKTGSMMVLNTVGICAPRLLWVWFVFPFFATPTMLYLIYPISWLTSSVLLGIAYKRTLKTLCVQV